MLEIYKDNDIEIYFSNTPKINVRYVLPWTNEKEAELIKSKPFLCKNKIKVLIKDKKTKKYRWTINKNYVWDGASIPRMFWRIIGSKTDNNFLIPSYIHDFLCENHSVIDNNRKLSSKIFKSLLLSCGTNKIKAQIMYLTVDNFQKFKGWNK